MLNKVQVVTFLSNILIRFVDKPPKEIFNIRINYENSSNSFRLSVAEPNKVTMINNDNYEVELIRLMQIKRQKNISNTRVLETSVFNNLIEKFKYLETYVKIDFVYEPINNTFDFLIFPMNNFTPKSMHIASYAYYRVEGIFKQILITQNNIYQFKNIDKGFEEFKKDFLL